MRVRMNHECNEWPCYTSHHFLFLFMSTVAMMSFIDDTPITTGSRKLDLLIPSTIVIVLSCAPDYGFLSKFSGVGLMAVGLSFVWVSICHHSSLSYNILFTLMECPIHSVISWQGFEENGCSGFTNTQELNLWPENLSSASSWFGVVVFGFGVVPFVYNFRCVFHFLWTMDNYCVGQGLMRSLFTGNPWRIPSGSICPSS